MAGDLSAVDDDWKAELRRGIALSLGISAWRVIIEYVRAGSVQVGVRIIDADGMGNELTAAASAAYLVQLGSEKFGSGGQLALGAYTLTEVGIAQPSPPPPPPTPLAPQPLPPPHPCDATDAGAFFNASLGCTPRHGLWTLRTSVAVVLVGGAGVLVLLILLWTLGYDDADRESVTDPFSKGKHKERERRLSEESVSARSSRDKAKVKMKLAKAHVSHPIFNFWRSSMGGMLDLLTDVLFCLSLYYDTTLGSGADGGGVATLFYASAACIAFSVVFNFTTVIWMYFGRSKDLARSVFDVEQKTAPKLFFFLVMLLAGFINIRLAALLPWKQTQRRAVLVRLQWLYLVGKCLEDLPQLAIAATYLAGRGASGELSGSAVGTAVLNMVISGASFLLTLLWLGLQAADSSKHRASRRAPSTKKLPRSSGLEQVKIDLDVPATVTEEAEHAEDAAGSGDVYPSPPNTRPTEDEPSDPGSRHSSISSSKGSRSRRSTLDHGADLVANL